MVQSVWRKRILRRACLALGFLVVTTTVHVGSARAMGANLEPAQAAPENRNSILILGRISDDPKTHYEQLKPLLDYVVPRMRNVGITEGRILMARDIQQMSSYLRRGRVDWVTETSGAGMQLQQRAGAKPMLITERDGVDLYHSVFFTRKDSGINSLSDMKGHSIAFQNTASTSGYLIPAATLLDHNLPLEILLSPHDRPASDSVGYVFARSALNISAWVSKKFVDVGVFSSIDWNNERNMPAAFRNELQIIHETSDIPRAAEMVRSNLDPKVEARLRVVLLQAADDPAAKDALALFFRTTRFSSINAKMQSRLQNVRKAVMRVRDKVE